MNHIDFENFGGFVHEAQRDGINMKRLYFLTGLNWQEFGCAIRDDTLSPDHKTAVATEIGKWRKELTNQSKI